jgi:hypothetical protein
VPAALQAGVLVAQYAYHAAWNALFHLVGPLLQHRGGAQAAAAASAQDRSAKGGAIGGLARSASRRQLASL